MSWNTGGPCPREFVVKIEGQRFSARNHNYIFSLYVTWKKNRGEMLPIDWEEPIWQALKKAYPKFFHKEKKKASSGVSVAAASSFMTFVLKRFGKSRQLVSTEEAKRRASICYNCPMKEPVLGCSVCKQALKLFVKPPEPVDAPPACGACGCWLPLKIWIPRKHLGDSNDFPYHSDCWMRE
jgi:hypothetical protein